MIDPALAIIRQQPQSWLTAGWLRRRFMINDADVWASLDRGRAVLDHVAQLNQYLWTHGLMIEAQWRCVVARLPEVERPARLIDYGCGQGIAGLLISELTGGAALASVTEIVIIEPSAVALARAEAVYRTLCPDAAVLLVPKRFDDVGSADIAAAVDGSTLHLFANTLDVGGFDPLRLLGDVLRRGRHTVLAVSHDREYPGGTPRFRQVKAAFEHPDRIPDLTINRSVLEQFKCGDNDKWDAVVWLCDLEVHHD